MRLLSIPFGLGALLRELVKLRFVFAEDLPIFGRDGGQPQILDAGDPASRGKSRASVNHLPQRRGDHRIVLGDTREDITTMSAVLDDPYFVAISSRRTRFRM